jgi:NitT/TauT family transport system substrate-binding protein
VNYDPQALRAEREGNGKVVATSATFPGCIPEGFVARTDVLKSIPPEDLAKIFQRLGRSGEVGEKPG